MTAKASAIQPDAVPASGPQHVLPELPYDYPALEACIDARTMTLHHDKHHAGYVNKLNELLRPRR